LGLCNRITDLVRENTKIVIAVCQELADATPRVTYADCFAEYFRTMGGALRTSAEQG
jgi:hypothetical protein